MPADPGIGDFAKIAPYLHDPLVLIGFFLFLAFLFARYLLKQRIIPPLPRTLGFRVLQTILLYGFIIGLLLITLGFLLRFQELRSAERLKESEQALRRATLRAQVEEAEKSRMERELRVREAREQQEIVDKKRRAEQQHTVKLLRGELASNLKTAEQIRRNTITALSLFTSLATATRTRGIKIMSTFFPEQNLGGQSSSVALADAAMDSFAAQKLADDELERQKFGAASASIVGTIDRTVATVRSLADPQHARYPITSQVWDANQSILREISEVDVSRLQRSYSATRSVRTDYDLVITRTIDYMEALREFLAPVDKVVNRQRLAKVLAAERLAYQISTSYADEVARNMAEIQRLALALSAPDAPATR